MSSHGDLEHGGWVYGVNVVVPLDPSYLLADEVVALVTAGILETRTADNPWYVIQVRLVPGVSYDPIRITAPNGQQIKLGAPVTLSAGTTFEVTQIVSQQK